MDKVPDTTTLAVFLMINPLIWQPFYVGTKRLGSGTYTHASARDQADLFRIVRAIRASGTRPMAVKIALLSDPANALRAETHWVKALTRGGVDVINYQAAADVRERALVAHLAACEQHAAEKKLKGTGVNQLRFDFNAIPAVQVAAATGARKIKADAAISGTDEARLQKDYLNGESIEKIASACGQGIMAILDRLVVMAHTNRAVYQKLVRDKLIAGSLGAYTVNPALQRCLGRRGSSLPN